MSLCNINRATIGKFINNLPKLLKIIILISIISVILHAAYSLAIAISVHTSGKSENQLCLNTYKSKFHAFDVKIPKCWLPFWMTPYESKDGIHGDSDLVLQIIEVDYPQAIFEVAMKNLVNGDLPQAVIWEKDRILKIPDTTITLVNPYNSEKYKGSLVVFTVLDAGYRNVELICFDWVTFVDKHGYVISVCSKPEDRKRIEESFPSIVESFSHY